MGEYKWLVTPFILNLGIWSVWVVSFKPRPLYTRGKSSRNPWTVSWCGNWCRSGRYGRREMLVSQSGNV